jgi:hypothetical protein
MASVVSTSASNTAQAARSSGSSQCLLFRTIARRYAGWPGGTFDEVGSSRAAVDGGPPRRFRGRSSPHLLLRSLSWIGWPDVLKLFNARVI